ncbi:keratin, type I cytoskeletal 13 isoform X2 [Pangasianodon hypophthalmus]|uniref:keratin, type I cytoskeletal 13 isoform X2 n=1 Tax=Pangasianodon hypophthalmus TaxID=310915 RepID=UPI000EFF7241|nr:keratin, type I cytoskeletal 13 isoform X2 [Pangasianodon hypophthalmus]
MSLSFKSYGTKTLSVYGGAGGQGTRISSSRPELFCGSSWQSNPADGLTFHISANEKAIMQNLNDRLASFIQKVHSLESSNAELERKINEWCAGRTVASHEYSGFLATIKSLRDQIQDISKSNGEAGLNIQNARLVADDFRSKYELELGIRTWVETDTASIRKVMDELTLTRSTLEMEYESLREEHILLRKNHEEEKAQIHAQAGGQMNVSVDGAPSTDLNQALTKIRENYEAVVAKNHRDQEVWYQNKISTVEKKFMEQTEDLEYNTTELSQLKSYFHKMQIELQSQLSMMSLEGSLQDSATRYAAQLAELQKIITDLELKLKQIHANITENKQDYDTLLEVKTNLEAEIKEYMSLLEVNGSDLQVARKKIAVVKLVESSQTVTTH